jgi:hypothetical protein
MPFSDCASAGVGFIIAPWEMICECCAEDDAKVGILLKQMVLADMRAAEPCARATRACARSTR